MDQAEKIAFFFTEPTATPEQATHDGKQSTLYLLRQEARDCLLRDARDKRAPLADVFRNPRDYRRVFATTMVLLAGIDLLGKFLAGTDDQRQIGPRFKCYAKKCMNLPPEAATALWKVRNAVMHSFGLYDEPKEQERKKGGKGERIALFLDCDLPPDKGVPVREEWLPGDTRGWVLCVEHLFRSFEDAIASCRERIGNEETASEGFSTMFDRYGWIAGGPLHDP